MAAPSEATSLDETLPARSGSRDETRALRLSATGALLGTPLYMAPEQHRGERATAAADQYAFCVALHEGLYGAPPFRLEPGLASGALLARLAEQKRAGPPVQAPAGSPVSPWIYRALAPGLAPDPADRYPSLDALVAALRDDPDARRRKRARAVAAGVASVALLGLAAMGWARSGAFRDVCDHPEQQLAGAWDDGVRERVRAAFLATTRPEAEGTVERVYTALDRYAGEWSAMRGEVCRAKQGGRERPEIADLRDECLDRRRSQLAALTAVLAERPDPDVLDRAARAAADLYPVASCADVEALTARVRPPEDPALRARVAEIEAKVDRLGALRVAGKYKDGLGLGEPIVTEAEAVGYAPLVAQARFRMGLLREGAGDYARAAADLRAAAVAAASGKDDVLVANAWAWLLFVVGTREQKLDEASIIASLGDTVLARADDERAEINWLNSAGLVLAQQGKHAEAKAAHERALAIAERVLGRSTTTSARPSTTSATRSTTWATTPARSRRTGAPWRIERKCKDRIIRRSRSSSITWGARSTLRGAGPRRSRCSSARRRSRRARSARSIRRSRRRSRTSRRCASTWATTRAPRASTSGGSPSRRRRWAPRARRSATRSRGSGATRCASAATRTRARRSSARSRCSRRRAGRSIARWSSLCSASVSSRSRRESRGAR
jgi:serine/threonine-protein kinase